MRSLKRIFLIWLLLTGALAADQMSVEVHVYVPENKKTSENFLGKTLTRNLILELQRLNLFRVYESDPGAPPAQPATFQVHGHFIENESTLSFATKILDASGKTIAEKTTVADSPQQRGNAIEIHKTAVIDALRECARQKAENPEEPLWRRIHYSPLAGYGWLSISNNATGKSLGDSFTWFGLDVRLPLSGNYAKRSHFFAAAQGGYSIASRNTGNFVWASGGIGYTIHLSPHTSITPAIYGGLMTGRADLLTTDSSAAPGSSAAIFILTYALSFDFRIFKKVSLFFSGSVTNHSEKNLSMFSPAVQGGIRFRL